jgi:hypothetical protein
LYPDSPHFSPKYSIYPSIKCEHNPAYPTSFSASIASIQMICIRA